MQHTTWRLHPVEEHRDGKWVEHSRWISQFRRGDFRRITQLIDDYFEGSAEKRQQRNPPFVSWFARELAPHYRHAPERQFLGDPATAQALSNTWQSMGLDERLQEASHRLVTQHTVGLLFLPMPGTAMRWQLLELDPWEMEVDPHPIASQSVSAALAIRCRVPRRAQHGRVYFDVLHMQRAIDSAEAAALGLSGPQAEACYYASDLRPVFGSGRGVLPLGRYPLAVGRLGDRIPGDFFGPIPSWLYQAQVGLSLAHCDNEFRNRYSAGQLVGYGLQKEAPENLDWGPNRICATEAGRDELEIVNIDRPYDAEAFARSIGVFKEEIEQSSGLPPSELGGAVTAEALQLKLWQRYEQRADVTQGLQRMEQSVAACLRYLIGWEFGAGSEPLPSVRVQTRYRMPEPPHNPLHMAQANRMHYEDGTMTPGERLRQQRPEIGQDTADAQALANAQRYAQIRSTVAGTVGDAPQGTTPPNAAR